MLPPMWALVCVYKDKHSIVPTQASSVLICPYPGLICILDIDVQGVKSIKQTGIQCNYIFVMPPTVEVLEQRLKGNIHLKCQFHGTKKKQI